MKEVQATATRLATELCVIVVTADDEPLIGSISDEALEAELGADRGGAMV